MGGGEDAKWTAPQTTAQTRNEELPDPSKCTKLSRTMWARTHGIDRWMLAKLVGRLTAKLVDRWNAKIENHLTVELVNCLTAKLVKRLTAKLMNPLTAKLEVVNLVKLHVTKYINQC